MQNNPESERRVVFLKLRKTGGTTLAASILYPYCIRHELRYMDPGNWFSPHPRLVQGDSFHMMFRHFPDYPQPWAKQWLQKVIGDYQLITILRDPVERAASAFRHAVRYHGFRSFTDYLAVHHEKNHQSHWLGYDGREPDFFEKNFSMIGLTERFNESMLLFQKTLNLRMSDVLYVGQRRDTRKAVKLDEIGDGWKEQIREIDWLDIELYEMARKHFENCVSRFPGLDAELEWYETALSNFWHPLWGERGSFKIGYAADNIWAEFTGQGGGQRILQQIGA